jgi:hypothetical protein
LKKFCSYQKSLFFLSGRHNGFSSHGRSLQRFKENN